MKEKTTLYDGRGLVALLRGYKTYIKCLQKHFTSAKVCSRVFGADAVLLLSFFKVLLYKDKIAIVFFSSNLSWTDDFHLIEGV